MLHDNETIQRHLGELCWLNDAGVLSVLSRFKDLGIPLYGFLGIVLLLGLVLFLILGAMIFWDVFVEQGTKSRRDRILKQLRQYIVYAVTMSLLVLGAFVMV